MTGGGVSDRIVHAAAPIRVCDNGGWTDTWFAGHGKVCNIAMAPGVDVEVTARPFEGSVPRVTLDVVDYGDRYGFELGARPGRHPLLEATVAEIGVPEDVAIEVAVSSAVPAASSTGTSAAVVVALIGALAALAHCPLTPDDVAATAHRIEVERLRSESGIQDQLCAAHGGISYIEMVSYPQAIVTPVSVSDSVWQALGERLLLVYLGRAHLSSDVHERVIARLRSEGPTSTHLDTLRAAAEGARDALVGGDLRAFGQVMQVNTAAQAALHPDLVGPHARNVLDLAAAHGAWGWKVNGAGGDGGTVTVLCGPEPAERGQLLEAITDADPLYRALPTRITRQGLTVWEGARAS